MLPSVSPAAASTPPAWQRCWSAELLRAREETGQRRDETLLVARLRRQALTAEEAILQRAEALLADDPAACALPDWLARLRITIAVAAVLALLAGAATALAVLGDGGRAVNLLWALLALLGAHAASLLVWLLAALWPAGKGWGAGWWRLLGALYPQRRFQRSQRLLSLRALANVLSHARAGFWAVASLSHALWSALLLGMLLGLLAALSLQQYDFVWETTLLPADVFPRLFVWLNALPGALGFALPEAERLLSSGGVPEPAARQAWAFWLLGCVLGYGLLPRLLLTALSGWLWRHRLALARIDLQLPYYQSLIARLTPDSQRIALADEQGASLPRFRVDPASGAGQGARIIGLELREDIAWPPPGFDGELAGPIIDSREQRRAVLAGLQGRPLRRLLLAVDTRLSPDRSSLALIAELSQRAAACAVWLLKQEAGAGDRPASWRAALLETGVPPGQVIDHADAAARWLQSEPAA